MHNPVAKFNNEFNKPKTFRNRKKHPSKKQQKEDFESRKNELHHPMHAPYKRCPTNLHNLLLEEDE